MSVTMRDEIVRIREGDLMDLRARVHELERKANVLEGLLRAEYHWHQERVRVIRHHLPELRRETWPGEDTLG